MSSAYVAVTLAAVAANGCSEIAALLHFRLIMPRMAGLAADSRFIHSVSWPQTA